MHASTWNADGSRAQAPSEVARAARYFIEAQVENGHQCPITMTRACVGALGVEPALLKQLAAKIVSRVYDPRFLPWWEKDGITLGMGMTEKQGGTDVRANTSTAIPGADGYTITGHKWFMSAPMCDAFLVLAQAPGGLTCFLMPRFRPDGAVNGLRFQRLKDKLGNRSNASSEVEFVEAFAWRVGEEGRGVRTIIEMVQLTRVDCVIGSAGMMRMALAQAVHHTRYRTVFQRKLADQPMMRTLLADMALEMEAVTALMMRLCRSFDLAATNPKEAARARLLTPAVKYFVCKSAPPFIYEAMECLGGNGYVEELPLARLYRECPVNAIWEGSGNVMCLDVLRALAREGEAARGVLGEIVAACADLPGAREAAGFITKTLVSAEGEARARAAVEKLALLAASAALSESAPAVAEAFARTRLATSRGGTFGTADLAAAEVTTLLDRVLPAA
jgi:putative acyl-CoA dehydrogenase